MGRSGEAAERWQRRGARVFDVLEDVGAFIDRATRRDEEEAEDE